jgi:hypothetical protein
MYIDVLWDPLTGKIVSRPVYLTIDGIKVEVQAIFMPFDYVLYLN